jgi:hypothetical protein
VVPTFDVASLGECQDRLGSLGAPCVQPPLFEVVELRYEFESGRESGQ